MIIQPETVVRWHRQGFKYYWHWKSRHGHPGRPRLDPEIRALLRRVSLANPLWGAPRTHGELLKLGIEISQTTVAKYMPRRRRPPTSGLMRWSPVLSPDPDCSRCSSEPSITHLATYRISFRQGQVLDQCFFEEIIRSAVPVDLRAIRHLRSSPLAMDLYIWLTHRMSYLKRPTLIPWKGLQAQFGADYSRPRDFRRKVLTHLTEVLRVYPAVRVGQRDSGLTLYPSPPHVQARPPK